MAERAADQTKPSGGRLLRLGGLGGRTFAFLALLALLVAAADRGRWLADWSADHRFSLSPSLLALLRQQREPVELVGIWGDEYDGFAEPIAEGLRLMAASNPLITYRHIDPVLHRPLYDAFATRYRERASPAIYVALSAPGADRAFKIPFTAGTRLVLQREVGGALTTLADAHPPQAVMLAGHGELRAGGGEQDGCDLLWRGLELAGFRVASVELARGQRIPADALLIVAGPLTPLGADDLKAIEQHLADGGSALVLGDDRLPADLVAALRRRGVLWGAPWLQRPPSDWAAFLSGTIEAWRPQLIASRKRYFAGQAIAFPNHNLLLDGKLISSHHPATAQVAAGGQSVLSPYSTPVQVVDPQQVDNDERAKALRAAYAQLGVPPFSSDILLATAPDDTWLKARSESFTEPQRFDWFPVLYALTAKPADGSVRDDRGARLGLWGSRQAASDYVLGQGTFANQALLVDLAKWLARRDPAGAIPEAETASFRVDLSDGGLFAVMAALVAGVPCLFIGAAMIAWWERR